MIKEELEYEQRYQVKPVVKECIHALLERFWVLREEEETLFYQIKDHESEIKRFFRDNFRYRMISNHDLVKLEKIPCTARVWMGDKRDGSKNAYFKTPQDFAFFFWILAFLEGKSLDQQFTLQNICEYLQIQEDGKLEWKGGIGYQNRLSLIRVMKYAEKMKLIKVVDLQIEDFSGDENHDVLLEKTPYSSHFVRVFHEDVRSWDTLDDFMAFHEKENREKIERKHRYYRRLFLESVVYHDEMTEEEQDYIRNYYTGVDNNIYRYTNFTYERYQKTSLLIKDKVGIGENIFPSDRMEDRIILQFANYMYENRSSYSVDIHNEIQITQEELTRIVTYLKKHYDQYWTKAFKQKKVRELCEIVVTGMKKWSLLSELDDKTYRLKEGLFRMVGSYK